MFKPNLRHNKEGERGSVIIFTVLILGVILTITLTLGAIFLPKIKAVSDVSVGSVGAIYAADSAIEWCIYTNRAYTPLAEPEFSNGATFTLLAGDGTPADCSTKPMDVQAVGTYRGVSRSLHVETPATPTPTP